jgi:hypothetical protein
MLLPILDKIDKIESIFNAILKLKT